MTPLRAFAVLALAILASVSVPRRARAETSPEVAALFKRGVDFYKEADFRAALVEFRRAYERSHDPRVLYNIAQCEYQLTNYVGALAAFERYLADGGAQVKDDKRAEVAQEISKLRGRVASLTLKVSPASAEVVIDGERIRLGAEPVRLNPGTHKLDVSAPGHARTLDAVEVAGGEARTLEVTLRRLEPAAAPVAVAAPPRELAPARSWTAPVVGYVVTGALAAGAVVLGVVTTGKEGDLAEAKRQPAADPARLRDLDGQVGAFALGTDVLLGATLLAAGVSAYLTVRTLSDPGGARAKNVWIAPSFGGITLGGRLP